MHYFGKDRVAISMDDTIKISRHKDSGISDTPQAMFEGLSLQNQFKMDLIQEILHEGNVHLCADKNQLPRCKLTGY